MTIVDIYKVKQYDANNVVVAPVAPVTALTTLQNAVGANGDGNTLDVSGYATAVFNISGMGTATVNFEASNDGGTTWRAINAILLGANTVATTATANGLYRANVAGLRLVRARVSGWAAGAITVTAIASNVNGPATNETALLALINSKTPANTTLTVTSVTANNADMVAATDVSSYRSGSIQLTSVGGGCTVQVQFSLDGGTTWSAAMCTSIAGTTVNANLTALGIFIFAIPAGALMRIRTVAYVSGTISAAVNLTSIPPTPITSITTSGGKLQLAILSAFTDNANVNPAMISDNADVGKSLASGQLVYTGTPTWQYLRTPVKFIDVSAVAIGAIATVWTPAAGKKFRLMGGILSASAAVNVLFEDNAAGAGNFVFRIPKLLVDTPLAFTLGGNGFLSAAANNVLKATGSGAANLTGTLYGTEE